MNVIEVKFVYSYINNTININECKVKKNEKIFVEPNDEANGENETDTTFWVQFSEAISVVEYSVFRPISSGPETQVRIHIFCVIISRNKVILVQIP